ncbi:MAG: thrombospondin type 3 repeat-containing protein [Microthrixaceae bacterium]
MSTPVDHPPQSPKRGVPSRAARRLRPVGLAAVAVVLMGAGADTTNEQGSVGGQVAAAGADHDGDGIDDATECHGSTELLVNGSFELPHTGPSVGYSLVASSAVAGWTNTEPTTEVWANGLLGAPPVDGTQIVELNGSGPSTLAQTVGVTPGQVLQWSVAYRLRSAGDRAILRLVPPAPGGATAAPIVEVALTGSTTEWTTFSGSVEVPAGVAQVGFALASDPQTNPGGTGNLVDAASLRACPDTDDDGVPDVSDADSDGDGIPDEIEGTGDPDGDETPNYRDLDSDGDGIPDSVEGSTDPDADGVPNFLDLDSDGNGIPDAEEGADFTADLDGDGIPDFLDQDTDGDGVPDSVEGSGDFDGDGIPDHRDSNTDHDRVPDLYEGTADTDGDGTPDRLDPDSDGDTIPDGVEGFEDVDGDGVPNFQDLDADGDGTPDVDEGPRFLTPNGIKDRLAAGEFSS